ncbi:MAG: RluA family pseudouridine synthase [Candidatus Doudnabacteria bacterium]|nr:RluA family pseudouridine synthase [Candidatus Doudnabacteria bacterium]
MQYTVTQSKVRLDVFLAGQLSGVSRTRIQKDIATGSVQVNAVVVDEGKVVVREGDIVVYEPVDKKQELARVLQVTVPVLFDDRELLIIDKPAGLSVHPGAGVKEVSLSEILRQQFPELEGVGEAHRPGIVHRLDKDTSGVMLVAKTQTMYEYLKNAFADRKIKKEYVAVCVGVPQKSHGLIKTPIGRDPRDFRKYTTKNPIEAKPSLTEYRVLEVLSLPSTLYPLPSGGIDKIALISVNLHTGRTHQIRVHMASLGHPLLGDTLYGGKKVRLHGLSRQFLHARRIEVQLPDGTWIEAESELTSDLKEVLTVLNSKQVSGL